jgi:plastocyanin
MRKAFLMLVTLAVLAFAPQALAANVTISALGFVPASLTINTGDTVTGTNTDVANHQLVSKKADLSSPVLSTGQSYSFVFKKDGSFDYQDAQNKSFKGTIVVQKPTPTPRPRVGESVSLSAASLIVVYGRAVMLSGSVSTNQAGEKVSVLAEEYGSSSYHPVATVTTGSGGNWSYAAKPGIRTGYQAKWNNATSSAAMVGVRPLVTLHVITGGRLSTRVVASRSFAGRYVQLQRRSSSGQWVTVKRVKLSSNSAAIFRASLPKGTLSLRSAISVNQAGAGFLGGTSRTITWHET